MYSRAIERKKLHRQRGATLIVSLVILAVVTVLGIASIRSSSLQLKMSASARDRAVAFQLAESALTRVESILSATPAPYNITNFAPGCTENCFTPQCNEGLCFMGDFDGAISKSQCRLVPTDEENPVQIWKQDADVWAKEGAHSILQLAKTDASGDLNDVKYIVEFMCYVPRGEITVSDGSGASDNDVPLYRITVRAEGEAQRSTVMLQSILRAGE